MFGFGKKPDHYSDLLDHMIEEMGIKPRYAAAFLNAYRSTISTNLERGIKQTLRMIDGMPGGNLLYHQLPNQLTTAIAAQAYNSFLHDLRKGRHVGTDVELVTWAILKTENDIFSQFDGALAAYIKANWRSKFPSLMEEVFSDSCDFDNPLMIFCAGARPGASSRAASASARSGAMGAPDPCGDAMVVQAAAAQPRSRNTRCMAAAAMAAWPVATVIWFSPWLRSPAAYRPGTEVAPWASVCT